jgi:acetylornithine deacetylase/succinyl-diaminopimelate desuccinylase-like protein
VSEGRREEVLELARRLIRIDTSNPPGNETPAAELLRDYLSEAGAECELAGPDPERLNLIARVRGEGGGPSLMMLAHTDVVPAPRAGWTVDPFAGEVRDGRLIGRGAADMKGELASRAVALAALAREGITPRGDVVLVAESDEERNTADVGMPWLVRERPELRCEYAINEGGGMLLELADGRRVVTIAVGEKQVCSLRIRLRGRAGHASLPRRADNPLRHLATAVERLVAYEPPPSPSAAYERTLEVLGVGADEAGLAAAARLHPQLADRLPAMPRMTITPTGTASSEPANVIPPFVDLICDCRAVPGQGVDDIHAHAAAALGDELDYELELLEPLEGGTESPIETRLYEACAEFVAERLPGAQLLPLISAGFSDSYWLRAGLDTVAYGFAPVFATDPDEYTLTAHGADEALAIEDLVHMTEFNLFAIRSLCGAPASAG